MTERSQIMLSQSSIQDYADCPRRFKLHYLDHLTYPALESEPGLENEKKQQEGQLFHRLVQQMLLGMDGEKLGRMAATPNLSRWWLNFLEHSPITHDSALFPEYSLSAHAGSVRITAKYDLIAIRGENLLIYDWKTYTHQPRRDWLESRWQTRVYPALLVRSGGFLVGRETVPPQNIKMQYWFPEFPDRSEVFEYSPAKFQRDWDAIEAISAEILTIRDFLKTDDVSKCSYCTYRSYCERGQAAAAESDRDAEWGLQAENDLDFEQIGEIAF